MDNIDTTPPPRRLQRSRPKALRFTGQGCEYFGVCWYPYC